MKKAIIYSSAFIILFCVLVQRSSFAQVSSVSIGTETVKEKAVLWLKGNGSQGLLLPVVNRSSFTGLNNSDEKGMIIFDPTDNNVYFWNGTIWVACGGGSTAANQTLTLNGNTFTLTGSPASNVPLANNAPATGQALVWNGTAWTAASLAGDVTGAANANQVTGIRGKSVPTLPTSTQALVYDGNAWTFQTLTSGTDSQDLTLSGKTLSLTNDATPVTLGDLAIVNAVSGGAGGTITDGSIQDVDISNNTITSGKLAASGATTGQVLKYNGTNWAPAADGGTTYSAGTGISITGTTITNTGDTNAADDLTTTSNAAGDVTGIFSNLQLAPGAVTSTEIADGTIANVDIANMDPAKLTQAAATAGQVLKWNGTSWTPAADDVGGGATPTLSNGQILTGNGTSNAATTLTGDATLSGGTLTIAANAIGSSEITDGSITTNDIQDGTVRDIDIAEVAPAKILQASATTGQTLKWNGTTWAPADDVGGTSYTAGAGISITGGVIANTGDTNAADDITSASNAGGDVTGTFSNLQLSPGVVTSTEIANTTIATADLANGAVTTAIIADGTIATADLATGAVTSTTILDGTIAAADLNAMSATNGQVLKFNGTNWAPATDAGTTYTAGTGIDITGSVVTNTGDTDASDDLTSASVAAGDVTGTFSNLQLAAGTVTTTEIANATIATADLATGAVTTAIIADGTIATADLATGAVTSTTILDGTIAAADLNAMSATNGQVLKFNGTNWVPAADASTTYTAGTGIDITGTTVTNTGDTDASDDLTTASTAGGDLTGTFTNLQLASGTVTSAEIADASIVAADLATGAVTTTAILDGTIAAADLSNMSATNGQVLKFDGTNWAPGTDNGISTTLASTNILVGNASNVATPVAMSGDATLTNTGVITISNGAVSGGVGGKITDASITSADLANGSVSGGTGGIITDASITGADLATNISISTSGNIATTGTGSLTVAGATTLSALGGSGSQMVVVDNTGLLSRQALPVAGWSLTGNTGTNPATNFVGTTDAQPLRISTNNTERIRISETGNVGIGTTTPNAPLQFPSVNAARKIVLYEQANNDHQFLGFGVGNAKLIYQVPGNPTDHVFQAATSSTSSIELMRITSLGTVGIGTSLPGTALHVTSTAGNAFRIEGSTHTYMELYGQGPATRSGYIGYGSAGDDNLAIRNERTGGNIRLMPASGFVGIGNVTPNAPLQIANAVGRRLVLWEAVNNDHEYIGFGIDGLGIFQSQIPVNSNSFSWRVGTSSTTSNELMRLTGVGNLGVGTASPAARLDVAGSIKITDGTQGVGRVLISDANGLASWGTPTSFSTLISNTGSFNLFAGDLVSQAGSDNAIFGYKAGDVNTGSYNVIIGSLAADAKTGGDLNTIAGWAAGRGMGTAAGNTFIGAQAGRGTTSGGLNTALGERAGFTNTTGNNNLFLGNRADAASGTLNNATAIGYLASVTANDNMVFGNSSVIGWGFGTAPTAGNAIVVGSTSANGNGARLTTGGVWTNASDRYKKENFQTLDTDDILMKVKALPITRWNYIGESKNNTHIGPMAQDFYALFQTGNDDKTISTLDPSGVALASIQALLKKIEDLQKENELLKSEKGALETKVSAVEQQQQTLQKDVEELKRILGVLARNK